jgi:hypothetical protein
MTFDDFREGMNSFWEAANRRARELKDPIYALERTASMYARLEREDRDHADRVFSEWLLSEDEAKRYVAVALIREFRVATAAPALRELVLKLRDSDDPGAPFEREKVEHLLSELDADGTGTA